MSVFDVFLRHGIYGVLCPLAFATLTIMGIVLGITRNKLIGYTYLAGAWLTAGAFSAVVASFMIYNVKNLGPGMATVNMFVTNLTAILIFLGMASKASLLAVVILAAAKFNRRHIVMEGLLVGSLCLFMLALDWYMKAMFDFYTK